MDGDFRNHLAKKLIEAGVYCTFKYFPLHLIEQYGSTQQLIGAETVNRHVLNIPLHQNLSNPDVGKVVDVIKREARDYYVD